jgi:hypothetical protein
MSEEWTRVLPDGRKVNYTYEEGPGDGALVTAKLEGGNITCSNHSRIPMTRDQIEAEFMAHLGARQASELSSFLLGRRPKVARRRRISRRKRA